MDQMLHVSSNPHVRSHITTSNIMLAVIIALLPAAGFGIYNHAACGTGASADHTVWNL